MVVAALGVLLLLLILSVLAARTSRHSCCMGCLVFYVLLGAVFAAALLGAQIGLWAAPPWP
ncbi:hypothetical protein [Nocardiopsis halophila]|uniref:hypothetical protein n=1 Tax=Nocardiopsis halophila TaxID=141692 RepID=UPI00034B289C|nr:hypothetical protein [Nocardiopsis halophila]